MFRQGMCRTSPFPRQVAVELLISQFLSCRAVQLCDSWGWWISTAPVLSRKRTDEEQRCARKKVSSRVKGQFFDLTLGFPGDGPDRDVMLDTINITGAGSRHRALHAGRVEVVFGLGQLPLAPQSVDKPGESCREFPQRAEDTEGFVDPFLNLFEHEWDDVLDLFISVHDDFLTM